jgi:S1-C subfamily serine protease
VLSAAIAQIARSLVFLEIERPAGEIVCGTGFVAAQRGWIATSHHLVHDARSVRARSLSQGGRAGEPVLCRTIQIEPQADLALLAANGPALPFAALYRGDPIGIGHEVAFMGFPYADIFDPPLAMAMRGMIGNRYSLGGIEYLVVDAFAAEGMSGGPLFLAKTGQVIGVVGSRFDPGRTRAKLRGASEKEIAGLPREQTNLTFATAAKYLITLIEKTEL